jgi:hypothetical protein
MKIFYVKGEVIAVRREDQVMLGFIKLDKIGFEASSRQRALVKANKLALRSLKFWKEFVSVDIVSRYPMKIIEVCGDRRKK